jgi:hypothetical protein
LRTGPLGRREAHIPRLVEGFSAGFSRPPAPLPVAVDRARAFPLERVFSRLPNALSSPSPLPLKCPLPINLREFLAEQFGAGLRMDEDGVFALGPEAGEETLSRIARAIRRFSTARAHEKWVECAVDLAGMGDDLDWAAEAGEQVVLCLRCAAVETGPAAAGRHRGGGCVAVELGAQTACYLFDHDAPHSVPERLLHVIEAFRLGRAALGLPHNDLDCYVARGQVIFTWRPLPD